MPPKEVKVKVKMMCSGGQATPAPPVGPTLGQHQVQPGEFVRRFNDMTKAQQGVLLPCVVTIYTDRTFEIEIRTPPASFLLKKAAGIIKGSGKPNSEKVGEVNMKQVEEIAKLKMKDFNTDDMGVAVKMVLGTARNMGITVAAAKGA
ncbi:MAG TPA: 50S ribosomal protein L11 [Planctomycetota bacterium]|nr:50S ribosomal protein L11 [Planctomycetota bacterium]